MRNEYTLWMNFAGIIGGQGTGLPSLSSEVMSRVLVSKALNASSLSGMRWLHDTERGVTLSGIIVTLISWLVSSTFLTVSRDPFQAFVIESVNIRIGADHSAFVLSRRLEISKNTGIAYWVENKVRRFIGIIIMLAVLLPLNAGVSADISTGYRSDAAGSFPVPVSVELSGSGFTGRLVAAGDSSVAGGISYSYELPFRIGLDSSLFTGYAYGLGGWTDLLLGFHQDWDWGWYGLSYGFGLAGGISYSEYADGIFWSLSPVLHIANIFRTDPFSFTLYAAFGHPWEMEWQLEPMIGLRIDAAIADGHSVYIDGYVKAGEYLFAPVSVVQSWAIRVGYVYGGGI